MNLELKSSARAPKEPPRSILMIKAHSMGVGDLLRSSAAWRALKNKWPDVQLHLLFLSKHEGYPTEGLIADHPLLSSAQFLTIQRGHPGLPKSERPKVPFLKLASEVRQAAVRVSADWIIDFEPYGARTSVLSWVAAKSSGAKSLGVAQVWIRSLFYTQCAPSVQEFAKDRGLELPLEYTNRDFVVLSAWGIERGVLPIELGETTQGVLARNLLLEQLKVLENQSSIDLSNLSMNGNSGFNQTPGSTQSQTQRQKLNKTQNKTLLVGLNIGCGTSDALHKRPDLQHLAECVNLVNQNYPAQWVLTGAPNELKVNEEFIKLYESLYPNAAQAMVNFAGRCSLSGLTGVICACDVFISTDSGPYHISVGLKCPTLVWFTYAERSSYHEVKWCVRLIQPQAAEFLKAFEQLTDRKKLANLI